MKAKIRDFAVSAVLASALMLVSFVALPEIASIVAAAVVWSAFAANAFRIFRGR
ncbi:MAG: hypothetical protein Q7J28_01305 [Caulobacter sp.]|nr:hypothetical protein [Caulobacter sp.]